MLSRHRTSVTIAALAGALLVAALITLALGAFDTGSSPQVSLREERALAEGGSSTIPPHGRPAVVSVADAAAGPAVSRDFIGLSFEASATPLLASYAHGGNLVGFMRSLGPGVLRLGGVSADQRVAWSREGTPRPSWASVGVTPTDLADLASLARETNWSTLLTVNLGHYDPTAAAQEAASAKALFGNRLLAVAIGNEPDRYATEGLRSAGWSFPEYSKQFGTYASAIARAAAGTPLAGPDASSGIPALPWVSSAASLHPALLTDHYYPLTSCGGTHVVASELLSPITRAHEDAALARLTTIAHASSTRLRIDETGSISCHGEPGVSNSFASSLWAVDWIARAMRAGIAGLNFHDLVSEATAYSPLVASAPSSSGSVGLAASLRANPDWYALLLTSRLPGSTPLRTSVAGDPALTAAAFASPAPSGASRRIQLVLVDFGSPSAKPLLVHLHVPSRFAGGSILRLIAPSPASVSHVELGASEVGSSGAWSPKLPLPTTHGTASSLSLEMPASSAALVTLEGTPRAHAH